MTASAILLPSRRTELVIKPFGTNGQYVVKDPHTRDFFHIGPEEHFLLMQLDGKKVAVEICSAFEVELGQPLSEDELAQFVEMAREQGFLHETGEESPPLLDSPSDAPVRSESEQPDSTSERELCPRPAGNSKEQPLKPKRKRQSILYWRKSLVDPDRFCSWLEPKIRFFWSRGFLVASALCILAASVISWTSRELIVSNFVSSLRWETVFWVWLTIFVVTMLHEFAHGLTCKHYGGEVHEIGFLLMFFMPCFYCNVSDAWLFREKSKRLWVTFAGGYFELFLWALAVFIWRLTVPDSMVNYLAFVVLASCGIQSFFNFNPLIKLDGYYLLSDWVEIPNLRQRSQDYMKASFRRVCWGADRPKRETRSRFLLSFGCLSWIYSIAFLGLMLVGMGHFLGGKWGLAGVLAVGWLGIISMRGMFQGFSKGEVSTMLRRRFKRTIVWLLILGGLTASLFLPMEARVSGTFLIHPIERLEIVAPHEGFLMELEVREGDRVHYGQQIGRLTMHGLDNRIAQKEAEVREAEAKLRLLEIGSRPEEIREQKLRVAQMETLHQLSKSQLSDWKLKLKNDLTALEETLGEREVERRHAKRELDRMKEMFAKNAVTPMELDAADAKHAIAESRWKQTVAQRQSRTVEGTLREEATLALRAKELADAESLLALLEAGSRPEEVAAARALFDRVKEELVQLQETRQRLTITSPISGVVTTPRLHERRGKNFAEGETLCEVEAVNQLEIVVEVNEQDVGRIEPGQPVNLKLRSLPFDLFPSRVASIAPRTTEKENASPTMLVTCRLDDPDAILRPGMTGYARISSGQQPAGMILLEKFLRYIRTEYWW